MRDTNDMSKSIIIIQTPVCSTSFKQVTCLMSDEELKAAKLERPDLVFKLADELPSTGDFTPEIKQEPDDETKGITVRGLTLPHDLDYLINQVLAKE